MMKHLLTIVLCLTTLTGLAQEEKIKKSEWWNGNPSYAVPIREVNVTARRPMKEIGIQKTQLDTTILHENIALSMADILTFNTSIFVKQYGRATLSTDPHRQPLVGNGFLDLHAGPSPTLRTDLERDRLQL